jgi:hypothetical protein
VVRGLVEPEVELDPVEPVAPVEPDPVAPVKPDPAAPVEPEGVALDVLAPALVFDSAGSWPLTNCTNSTAQTSANTTAAVASTRLRILVVRRRCAPRRSAATCARSGRAAADGARTGRGYVDPSGVIVTSISLSVTTESTGDLGAA